MVEKTKTIECSGNTAKVNPTYELENLLRATRAQTAGAPALVREGAPARVFDEWYQHHRLVGRGRGKRRNPWLVRGLSLAVVEPEPRGR